MASPRPGPISMCRCGPVCVVRMQLKIRAPADPFGHMRFTYTGKNAGNKDDLVMAFLQGLYHGSLFWQKRNYAEKYGFTATIVNGRARL
jgi:hypothetical protein